MSKRPEQSSSKIDFSSIKVYQRKSADTLITARHDGECAYCREPYYKGEFIYYLRDEDSYVHRDCKKELD